MIFKIKLAEKIIQIQSIYTEVYDFCHDYLIESEHPDLVVLITQEDIINERAATDEQQRKDHTNNVYEDSYLETLAVYRKIAAGLLDENIILLHGVVVKVGNNAFIFTAPSGTGKTTHTQFWVKEIPGAEVINGDKPLLRITDSEIIAYGTPWAGKEKIQINTNASVRAIFCLERADENVVSQVTPDNAFTFILQQSFRPNEPEKFVKLLSYLSTIVSKVPVFRLQCNKKTEAAHVAFDAIRNLMQ